MSHGEKQKKDTSLPN
jgi:hypothetical protein